MPFLTKFRTLSRSTNSLPRLGVGSLRGVPKHSYSTVSEHFPHETARSGDTLWIIGALAVFGPTMAYLLSPGPTTHSSTSLANPVPDKWAQKFDEEGMKAMERNHPIKAEYDSNLPAGEGRPHGSGDKALREISQSTDTHPERQVSMATPTDLKAIPEKMDVARAHSAERTPDSTTIDTKTVSAQAHTDHQEKHS